MSLHLIEETIHESKPVLVHHRGRLHARSAFGALDALDGRPDLGSYPGGGQIERSRGVDAMRAKHFEHEVVVFPPGTELLLGWINKCIC